MFQSPQNLFLLLFLDSRIKIDCHRSDLSDLEMTCARTFTILQDSTYPQLHIISEHQDMPVTALHTRESYKMDTTVKWGRQAFSCMETGWTQIEHLELGDAAADIQRLKQLCKHQETRMYTGKTHGVALRPRAYVRHAGKRLMNAPAV